MIYLLDANVLIDANRDYYPIERVPEFWSWLVYVGGNGQVKLPVEVFEEVKDGNDELALWAKDRVVQAALLFAEDVQVELVNQVSKEGYAPDLTDDEIEKLGRDPFLIAHALADIQNRIVVTTEVSKPSRKRANRHVPDVSRSLGIKCINTFEFAHELNFTTRWNND